MMPLTNSIQCEEYLRNIWEKNTIQIHERVYAVYLNHTGERVFHALINKGSYSSTNFDRREAMQYALNVHSNHIVIAHNHPNGDCEPSEQDIITTREVYKAFGSFDIYLVDSIILTHDNYFSFKDNGLLIAPDLPLVG